MFDFCPLKTNLIFSGRLAELQLPQRQEILQGQKGQVLPILVYFQYSISQHSAFS